MHYWEFKIEDARKDERSMEDFIKLHEAYIIKSASRASRHFVTKSDDEWSIALSAFLEAVEKYEPTKGSFLSFAGITIRSRLIDWFRTNGRQAAHVHTEDMYTEKEDERYTDDLRLEIHALGETLIEYGISYQHIAQHSPKAGKTKESCKRIIRFIINDSRLVSDIRRSGNIPIKIIEENLNLPRKTIERHRKYIIAAVVILTGDYPYLSEYVRYVREEE